MGATRVVRKSYCNIIKCILLVSSFTYLWSFFKQYFPPPPTFWHAIPRDSVIPLRQKLSIDSQITFLKNCSLMVAVCTRNVGTNLPVFRKNIENITFLFGKYHIWVGESDSSDKTLLYLHAWAKVNNQVTIKTYGNLSRTTPRRSDRIAHCRNDLLDEVRRTGVFRKSKNGFYMVVDADMNSRLNQLSFLSNFDYALHEWGAMTANQHSGYYDIWALRNHIVFYDCWRVVRNILIMLFTLNRAVELFVGVHQKTIPSNHSLIPVNSAFGGAAIYQTKYLNGCRYSGYESHSICEHVPFNLCVTRNGGKMFINPRFQID